jgi:hypothetical protein
MSDSKRDYQVGPGKPPLYTPLPEGPTRQPPRLERSWLTRRTSRY